MRKLTILLGFFAFFTAAQAQKPYFQQQVNFMIDVRLNDQEHSCSGNVAMEYINNSPDELTEIYLHLWANAFSDRNTAFNRQKLRQGSSKFYFAEQKDLGNYSGLNFTVDGASAELILQKDNPDIAILTLPKPLASGSKAIIESPFTLKIPASFSRLGHVGESYQMTQWYPKPAVYDNEGWHPMPYLDMGEYYSEFGNYEVSITLPENYIVGSTGALVTASEKKFLERRIMESNQMMQDTLPKDYSFPPSSTKTKTITFQAENVHDFAWFADKRFYVQKSAVKLSNGKTIDTYTYFTNQEGELWKKAIGYVDRSVKFYSDQVGNYPWPHATAVQSALSAGGGMEYPMITVIGLSGDARSLDVVITHEVGHNWFYGILGFNERDHAWLDEGINSYYDHRYQYDYYGNADVDFLPPMFSGFSDYSILELGYLLQARRRADQAPSTHSDDYVPINYWLGAYEKPAVVLRYLEYYLGTEKFDGLMKSYYKDWAFKHPSPASFREHIASGAGEKLDWFFDGFIYSNDHLDYGLSGAKTEGESIKVTAKNKGDIVAPFPIDAVKDDKVVKTIWVDGFEGEKEVDFPKGDYDYLNIDHQRLGVDVNRKDNIAKITKAPAPLRVGFITGLEQSNKKSLFISPLLGWNNYDKTIFGAAIYNKTIPAKKFEFQLAPMFSVVTKKLRGLGEVNYNIFPKSKRIEKVAIGLTAKSFASNYNWKWDFYSDYLKIAPSITIEMGGKEEKTPIDHKIRYRPIFLSEQTANFALDSVMVGVDSFDYFTNFVGQERTQTLVHHLQYTMVNRRAINPWSLALDLRQSSYEAFTGTESYLRASATWKGEYTYARNRGVNLRLFAGTHFNNTRKDATNYYRVDTRPVRGTFDLTAQGVNDELYDYTYFGRSESNDIWSQQIHIAEGGFKNALGAQLPVGKSNSLLLAANITGDLPQDLPLKLPLKPYFDLGYLQKKSTIGGESEFEGELFWSLGVSLDWFDERLAIYFPIVSSDNIQNNYPERGNYFGRVTYQINLNRINPFKLIDKLEF